MIADLGLVDDRCIFVGFKWKVPEALPGDKPERQACSRHTTSATHGGHSTEEKDGHYRLQCSHTKTNSSNCLLSQLAVTAVCLCTAVRIDKANSSNCLLSQLAVTAVCLCTAVRIDKANSSNCLLFKYIVTVVYLSLQPLLILLHNRDPILTQTNVLSELFQCEDRL